MKTPQSHIILMGFKHVGKTSVGRELAAFLRCTFVDLDDEVEAHFEQTHQKKLSCRAIMQEYGQAFFREIESASLRQILKKGPSVIALGGGTPISSVNRELLMPYVLVHVTAPRDIVFSRIMAHGRPAFFPTEEDPKEYFQKLWEERNDVYCKLAMLSAQNNGTAAETAQYILSSLTPDGEEEKAST